MLLRELLNGSKISERCKYSILGTTLIFLIGKILLEFKIESENRELNIVAIDARFSKLGFYGLENLKATKNLKYLNASYTRYFDDHW